MKSRIMLAGGTGFLGKILLNKIKHDVAEIVVLTRFPRPSNGNIRYVEWDGKTIGGWLKELELSDAIINLVGLSPYYRNVKRKDIANARTNATTILGKAISICMFPPKVWIDASSASIFGNSGEELKHEKSPTESSFSSNLCKQWEKAFHDAHTPNTRKVLLRVGLVLQHGEGLIKPLVNMVKVGLGGRFGSGEQYVSWIHGEDFANTVKWAIKRNDIEGILHCTSPYPVKNKELMRTIRKTVNVRLAIPQPAFLVRFGAKLAGSNPEFVLQDCRVVSTVQQEKGFSFSYPNINEALFNVLRT